MIFMVSPEMTRQVGGRICDSWAVAQHVASPSSVTLYDCAVGHPDCSHCQAANGSLSCLWCGDGQPSCRYGPLCPPDAVEQLCPTPTIDMVRLSLCSSWLPHPQGPCLHCPILPPCQAACLRLPAPSSLVQTFFSSWLTGHHHCRMGCGFGGPYLPSFSATD